MTSHRPTPFTRRRFLAAVVAAACGAALPALARPRQAGRDYFPGPIELPLSAANLYTPHDLAG
jgi:hypothetical protein